MTLLIWSSGAIVPNKDFENETSGSPTRARNEPASIFAAWTALEALSPQIYRRNEDLAGGDRKCVANLAAGSLVPWSLGERSPPDRRLYYQVILGSILMAGAAEALNNAFGDDGERNMQASGKAAIAAVLIDNEGILVEENSVAASSFAWALPLALALELETLGIWPNLERSIADRLLGLLRRFDDDGRPLPLDHPTILKAYGWLVKEFRLPVHLVEPPTFAVRIYQSVTAKRPPEVLLLNSFFINDVVRASHLVTEQAAPTGLCRYVGLEQLSGTIDLLHDKDRLEQCVAPASMPAVRWPTPSNYPLVMLQQAAVNIVRSELGGRDGIVSVNGPPGTGKTTLLRDVVAACVFDRALAMTGFDDPEQAFTPAGERVSIGRSAVFHPYKLDPRLKGHEIFVASSNNKAVENISKELPAARASGRATEFSYFKSISDCIYAPKDEPGDDKIGTDRDLIDTWGLVAAVLGNAKNRRAFQQTFWWDADYSFRLYLKAARGDSVVCEIKDPRTGKIVERRTPAVIVAESPPSPNQAKANWRRARGRFLDLKHEVDVELQALENVRQLCLDFAKMPQEIEERERRLIGSSAQRSKLDVIVAAIQARAAAASTTMSEDCLAVRTHRELRPGLFGRLFSTRRWRAWSRENASLRAAERRSAEHFSICQEACDHAAAQIAALDLDIQTATADLAAVR